MKKRIMIVDDEKDFCYFIQKNLEEMGEFDVTVCYAGEEGIRLAKELHPDLLILDIMMPGISGPDIAADLKEDNSTKNIPIIFLTAIIQEQEVRQNRNVICGWHYLAKPIKMMELVSLINKLTKQETRINA